MKLFLIRHAQSVNNSLAETIEMNDYLAQRVPEPPITALGERQAALVAQHLQHEQYPELHQDRHDDGQSTGYGITQLFCSPMLRTLQTTRPISTALGLRPEIWIDIHEHGGIFRGNPRLNDVAGFPGLTRSEIMAQYPDYVLADGITEKGWWVGDYEEMEGCYARATKVAATLRSWATAREGERIALVSHGTFLDALIKALFGQDFASQLYYTHYNTAISRIDFTPKGFLLLRYLNRTEHLSPELITR